MNIFYLDNDVSRCAKMHNDKHCVKMILEYAQLLSTAHRVLDGVESVTVSNNRKKKLWVLNDDRDSNIYTATHINHPSAIWARDCADNYWWLFNLWLELMDEYTYRYGKEHACGRLIGYLSKLPNNISTSKKFYPPTPAMPQECIVSGDSLKSYRLYYNQNKVHLAKWKNRPIPEWFYGLCDNPLDKMAGNAQLLGLLYD